MEDFIAGSGYWALLLLLLLAEGAELVVLGGGVFPAICAHLALGRRFGIALWHDNSFLLVGSHEG